MGANKPEYSSKYYIEHKQEMRDQQRKDRHCETCNKTVKGWSYCKHIKTKKHLKKLEELKNENIENIE